MVLCDTKLFFSNLQKNIKKINENKMLIRQHFQKNKF